MEDRILQYIKNNFSKKTALGLGFFLLLLLLSILDDFIAKLITDTTIRFLIYLVIALIWLLLWLYYRRRLPKNKKGYVGIVVCIKAENDKQKARLKKDFIGRLNKLILENKLGNLINVLLPNEQQTNTIYDVIDKYSKDKTGEGVAKWNKLKQTIGSHFYIYGDIIERQDEENKYFLDLEALVIHYPVGPKIQSQILKDFLDVWYKQISFKEKIEFKGFRFTADSVFIAVKYVVGIAALVSQDIQLALRLHESLINDPYFKQFDTLPPNLEKVKNNLVTLLAEENLLIARLHYYRGNLTETRKFLDKSLSMQNNYGGLLLKAILETIEENDPEKALQTIRQAKRLSKGEHIWLYSEAFLLMKLERFDEALKSYRKIAKGSYEGEDQTLEEIMYFNEKYIKENPKFVQSYFVIAYLKYKKESNYPMALEYFNKFLDNATDEKYGELVQKANSYKTELEHKMQI